MRRPQSMECMLQTGPDGYAWTLLVLLTIQSAGDLPQSDSPSAAFDGYCRLGFGDDDEPCRMQWLRSRS